MRLVEMVQPLLGKDNYREVCKGASGTSRPARCVLRDGLQQNYFLTGGVAGVGAGCVFTGCDFTPSRTEVLPVVRLLA